MGATVYVPAQCASSALAFISHVPLTLSPTPNHSKLWASTSKSSFTASSVPVSSLIKRDRLAVSFHQQVGTVVSTSTPIRVSTTPKSISISISMAMAKANTNANTKTKNILHSVVSKLKTILRVAVLGLVLGFLSMAPTGQFASIRWLNMNSNHTAHAAAVKSQPKVKQNNAKVTESKTSNTAQGFSESHMTIAGTMVGGALIMLVKTLRSKKEQEVNTKKPEEIKVVRYDKVMEETWKKEDQLKKEEAAKEATGETILSDLQKRIKDLNVDQNEVALPSTEIASPVEMTDMINSLERLWKEDKDDINPNGPGGPNNEKKKKKNSGPESRMGSWAGMGSALLEPDKNSSFSTPNSNDELVPPQEIPTETLNLLRKCWDASADDSNKK
eukprot:CAMPEP_0184693406 /NCGR_PEP_ID=MMETSP0313-20130426/1637_1 /TAXON_ID=2792 /ORGANISM="Porphyridium aerugineum, Strain SAG 1380-2" /LENGTH=386 /DNA_ID=CAMNT_0027151481 /DNA_START=261 /DNA_END=1421 /DNA_ORIENTATION=-